MSRKRVAYGCAIASPDDDEAKAVWLGRLVGYPALQTKKGCWHAEIVARKNPTTAIAAEVCMPTEHHIIGLLQMFDELPIEKQVDFIERHLPMVAAEVDKKERAEIRAQILRP